MSEPSVENGARRRRRVRPLHWLRFRWQTRHWNRKHGPGCPSRYGSGACLGIEGWCVTPPAAGNAEQGGEGHG